MSRFVFFALLMAVANVATVKAVEPEDWPQWRGPNREGIANSGKLLRSWPEGGPKVKWQVNTVGVGYSSVAVAHGRIYTQGDLHGVEHVIALSAEDGRVLWKVQPGELGKLLDAAVKAKLEAADKDGDGELNFTESIAAYGWNFLKHDVDGDADKAVELAAARTDAIMKAYDANGDNKVDFSEARQLRGLNLRDVDRDDRDADAEALAKSRIAALLKEFDKDGDGSLSKAEAKGSEIQRDFNRADQRDKATKKSDERLTAEELERYYTRVQGGRDGVLTAEELAEHLAKRYPKGDGSLSADEIRSIDGGYRNGMGDGPRGTPTVSGDRIYVEGGNGAVSCLTPAGETVWQVSLRDAMGGRVPGWGYSESPLVVDNLVIVTPGGKGGTLAALDKATGNVVWRTESVQQGAHYSSPIVAEIHGVQQVVQFARESVFAVRLTDGKQLWSYSNAANGTANCATPIVHENHVFASSAYGTGGGLAKIEKNGDEWSATEVYFDKKMANHHGGIVRLGNHMYGFGNGGLLCMNFKTGEHAWADRSVGKGSLIAADGLLFLLGEGHKLGLAEASPKGYVEKGRVELESHGRPSWAHPALANGVLYIRDQDSLTAYQVR